MNIQLMRQYNRINEAHDKANQLDQYIEDQIIMEAEAEQQRELEQYIQPQIYDADDYEDDGYIKNLDNVSII